MSEQGGTVRYHRVEYLGDVSYPWEVWFDGGQGPIFFTAEQGEAMGLTVPEPAPLVVTCNGHSIELSDEEARAFVQEWGLHGDREDFFMLSNHDLACDALAGLLRDARQDPQPASEPASCPWCSHGTPCSYGDDHPELFVPQPEQDDTASGFDALPIGTVLTFNGDTFESTIVRQLGGWRNVANGAEDIPTDPNKWKIAYFPPPMSPGECLRGLLAGRDDADELIEYAKQFNYRHSDSVDDRLMTAIGDAARGGASDG